jgi:hypothetical protein
MPTIDSSDAMCQHHVFLQINVDGTSPHHLCQSEVDERRVQTTDDKLALNNLKNHLLFYSSGKHMKQKLKKTVGR